MEAITYRNTQSGLLTFGIAAAINLLVVAWLVYLPVPAWIPLAALAILVVVFVLFGNLTVEINGQTMRAIYGVGLIRKKFDLARVVAVREVRNKWYYGWGIRITPHGWLYNIAGLGAVELEYENGKRVRVGSDEPGQLKSAIEHTIGSRGPLG